MNRQNTYDADERPLGRRMAERPAPGLGDAVAAMAKAAGLKETKGCGCARRRATLNRWTPAWLSQLLGRLVRAGSRPAR
jgi:hypothetical protein